MRIEKNININMGGDVGRARRNSSTQQNTFYAGTRNEGNDAILLKKQMAQRKAIKVVSDAFCADRKLDNEICARESEMERMKEENRQAKKSIRELETRKTEIGREYGLGEDGLSEDDWNLLEKNAESPSSLSHEEASRIRELKEQGLCVYYDRCVEIDDFKKSYQNIVDENNQTIKEYQAINKAIHTARLDLKNNPMIAAGREAEQIQENARQEIIGMLIDESKDHVDQEMEQQVEKAEEAKEEKKAQEEKLEAAREKREEMVDSLPVQELIQMDGIKTDIQQEIQDILGKMKLVEEDIKGAAVDTTL